MLSLKRDYDKFYFPFLLLSQQVWAKAQDERKYKTMDSSRNRQCYPMKLIIILEQFFLDQAHMLTLGS